MAIAVGNKSCKLVYFIEWQNSRRERKTEVREIEIEREREKVY